MEKTSEPVVIEDVVVVFSQEEWALLDLAQKHLYMDVMMENLRNLDSVVIQHVNDTKKVSSGHMQFKKNANTQSSAFREMYTWGDSTHQLKNQGECPRSHKIEHLCENAACNPHGRTFGLIPNLSRLQSQAPEVRSFQCCECGKAFLEDSSRNHSRCRTGCAMCMCEDSGAACPCLCHGPTTPGRALTGISPHGSEERQNGFTCVSTPNRLLASGTGWKRYEGTKFGEDFRTHVGGQKCDGKNDSETSSQSFSSNSQKAFGDRDQTYTRTGREDGLGKASSFTPCAQPHSREEPHEWKDPGPSISRPSLFSNGRAIPSGGRPRPHKCQHCGRTFRYSSVLTIHMRTHTGERPYKCPECGQAFSCPSAVTTHMRTHTGERPYECQDCGKAFSCHSALTRHVRTHTGKRPYECKECGRAFSQSSVLTRHIQTHTGETPYECPQCGKCLTRPSALTIHMRTHTGERPFECKECGKSFYRSSHLTRHKRIHTKVRIFECKECGKFFKASAGLSTHLKTHRRQNMNVLEMGKPL